MATSFSSKCCANCTYWTGPRTVGSGKKAQADSMHTKGQCMHPKTSKAKTNAGSHCINSNKWELWPVVKV